MSSREEIHNKLLKITPNVYFQPGDGVTLNYPCITYKRTIPVVFRANEKVYNVNQGYVATYMTKSSDSKVIDFLNTFRHCSNDNEFTSDGVNHEVFTIY